MQVPRYDFEAVKEDNWFGMKGLQQGALKSEIHFDVAQCEIMLSNVIKYSHVVIRKIHKPQM